MKTVLLLCMLVPCFVFCTNDINTTFEMANKHYDEAAYDQAIETYNEILDQGYHSAEVYFNLGNSHYKTGQLAEAILNYERAHKLNPSGAQILNMLSLVRDDIDSEVIEVQDFLLVRYWNKMSQWFKPVYWMFFQFVFGLFMLYGVYQWKFALQPQEKVRGLIIGISAIGLLLICYLAGAKSHSLLNGQEDAIVMQNVTLMSGPESRSEVLNEIISGEKVKVLDEIDNWYKVQLLNKATGWISVGKLEFI